jgi:hypothetical protein
MLDKMGHIAHALRAQSGFLFSQTRLLRRLGFRKMEARREFLGRAVKEIRRVPFNPAGELKEYNSPHWTIISQQVFGGFLLLIPLLHPNSKAHRA